MAAELITDLFYISLAVGVIGLLIKLAGSVINPYILFRTKCVLAVSRCRLSGLP